MLPRTLMALSALVGCQPDDGTPAFRLSVVPHTLDGQDPFRGDATLVLQDPDGTVTEHPLGSPEGDREAEIGEPLAPGTTVGLQITDGDTPIAWGAAPLHEGLVSGEATVEVLVSETGRLGSLGDLAAPQALIGAAVAVLPGGDGWTFGGTSAEAADNNDGSTDVIRHLSGLDTTPTFEKIAVRVPQGTAYETPLAGRVGAAAIGVTTDDGVQVLVTGGRDLYNSSDFNTNHAFLFDPVTEAVTWEGNSVFFRSDHQLVAMSNGDVVAFGGFRDAGVDFPVLEVFDPSSRSFRETDGRPDVGELHAAAAPLGDQGILICGGADYNGGTWFVVDGCSRVTLRGQVVAAASVPVAVSGHAMAALPGGDVLLVGGYHDTIVDGPASTDHGTAPASNRAFVYDSGAETWSEVGPLKDPRAHHAAVSLGDGSVVVFGGTTEGHGAYGLLSEDLPCLERYDPETERFTRDTGCGRAGSAADPPYGAWPGEDVVVIEGWTADLSGLAGGQAYGLIGTGPILD